MEGATRSLYIAQRRLKAEIQSSDAIIHRFPSRHSCKHCDQKITNALQPKHDLPVYVGDGDGAIRSASDGCLLFEWLLDFWILSYSPVLLPQSAIWQPELTARDGFYLQGNSISRDFTDICSVSFLIGTDNYSWPCASFDVFTEQRNSAAPYISSRPFQSEVGSNQSFHFVKKCLAECDKHERYSGHRGHFLPTRLLALGSEKDISLVKLVSSQLIGSLQEASYATLSYVWGGNQTIQTTISTLRPHEAGIETSNLGQTFLCIVQDSPEDVATEISRMMDYYENCFICISAAAASISEEGFLKTRTINPYEYGPFELPYRSLGGCMGSVKFAKYHQYQNSKDPANKRGWILQESLLAPRLLSYSYFGMSWSCRQTSCSNGGPNRKWHDFKQRNEWAEVHDFDAIRTRMHPVMYWLEIIKGYASRQLTVPMDNLLAISGVAQKLADIMDWYEPHALPQRSSHDKEQEQASNISYFAGIWFRRVRSPLMRQWISSQLFWSTTLRKFRYLGDKKSLEASLVSTPRIRLDLITTYQDEPNSEVHRSQEYLAPTWSWAAIRGQIVYEDQVDCLANAFEIISLDVELEMQQAPYSAVKHGRMTVRGRMRQILWPIGVDPLGIVFRPDTEEDDEIFSKILRGEITGWMLEAAISAGDKPKYPMWNPRSCKCLALVAEGTYYRRIGLCSLKESPERGQDYQTIGTPVPSFNEPQTITII